MQVFRQLNFWQWLYSFGQQPLDLLLLDALKVAFVYQKDNHQSSLDGQAYTWTFETLRLDLPIGADAALCCLLALDANQHFEETLYLKYLGQYYILGWFDSHQHSLVFRYKEFKTLMHRLSQSLDPVLYSAYYLLLIRYVTLTEESQGIALMEEAPKAFSNLLHLSTPPTVVLTEDKHYGQAIPFTNQVFLFKKIHTPNAPLYLHINEGLTWQAQPNGRYHLQGFANYSMRTARFDAQPLRSIDPYDVKAELDHYCFPYQWWENSLSGSF